MTPEEQAWRDLYDNMILDIEAGATTRERLERIRYYTDRGDLDKFIESGIDVDNDLTYLHQSRYRNILADLGSIPAGEDRQEAYRYYQNEIEMLKSWGLLKELAPSVERDLANLGLVEDKPLLRDAVDTVTNWWDGRKADETEIARAEASGDPNWLAAAQTAGANNSPFAGLNPVVGAVGLYEQTHKEVYGGLSGEKARELYVQAYTEPQFFPNTSLHADNNNPVLNFFGNALKGHEFSLRFAYNATFGPAINIAGDIYKNGWTQSDFGEKWREHPAAALTEGAFAGLQALVPLEAIRPSTMRFAETNAAKLANGAGKFAETIKSTDIYGGLEPVLAGEGMLNPGEIAAFEDTPIDGRMQIKLQPDAKKYLGKNTKTLLKEDNDAFTGKSTLRGTYTQRDILKNPAKVLGKEGELAGRPKPGEHFHPHHIFPINFEGASAEVRAAVEYINETIEKCLDNSTKPPIIPDKNAAWNLAWLPDGTADLTDFPGYKDAAIHRGCPADEYIFALRDELQKTELKAFKELERKVQGLRKKLMYGELKINNAVQKSTIELDGQKITHGAIIGLSAENNLQPKAANEKQLSEQQAVQQNSIDVPGTTPVKIQSPGLSQKADLGAAVVLTVYSTDLGQASGSMDAMRNSGLEMINQSLNTVHSVVNDTMPHFHEVAVLIRRQEEEKNQLQKERAQLQGKPLTQEEAEQRAIANYTKGESTFLQAENIALDDALASMNTHKEQLGKLAENLGVCRYLPDFAIRWMDRCKVDDVHCYEAETAEFKEKCKDYSQRNDAYNAKMLSMHKELNTPEARTAIAEMTGRYIAEDQERLDKLANIDSKLQALEQAMTKNMAQAAGLFVKQESGTPQQRAAAWRRITEIMDVEPRPDWPGAEKLRISAAREYRIQAKDVMEREGCWPGQDADREIAVRMYAMGYSRFDVAQGITQASPGSASMTAVDQSYDYGRNIVTQIEAMGYGPSPSGLSLGL